MNGTKRLASGGLEDNLADGDASKRLCLDGKHAGQDVWSVWPVLAGGDSYQFAGPVLHDHAQEPSANYGSSQEVPMIVVQGPSDQPGVPRTPVSAPGLYVSADMSMVGYDQMDITDTSCMGIAYGEPMMSASYQSDQSGLDWYPDWHQQADFISSSGIPIGSCVSPTVLLEQEDWSQAWAGQLSEFETNVPSMSPGTAHGSSTPAEDSFATTPTGTIFDAEIPELQVQRADSIWNSSDEAQKSKYPSAEDHADENEIEDSDPEHGEGYTCFGEIIAPATSSFEGENGSNSARVQVKPFGNVLQLSFADTEKYAGIVCEPGLVTLLAKYTVRLVATLFAGNCKPKAKPKKGVKTESSLIDEHTVRIVVYGLLADMEHVSACLSEAKLFLQHPSTVEYTSEISYYNPHYLVRPGGVMPRLEDLDLSDESEKGHSKCPDSLSGSDKSRFMRIFDSANRTAAGTAQEATSSPRLATPLKEHQLVALSMMLERESGSLDDLKFPSLWRRTKDDSKGYRYRHIITGRIEAEPAPLYGGVLADDMGLGKTLSLLALVCSSLDGLDKGQVAADYPRATLIVAPKTTIPGWETQINRHIKPGQVRYLVYHGPKRQATQQVLSQGYDIIITTYETLQSDVNAGRGLHTVNWHRVVLDEAHRIRNRSSKCFHAAATMRSHFRWCLTGTPIQNSLDDYGSLLSFLRVPIFGDKRGFDHWIKAPMGTNQKDTVQILQYLVAATSFRRTKAMVKSAVELPRKMERSETVQLTGEDRDLYEFFKAKASKAASQIQGAGIEEQKQNTLAIINILRLICNHGEQLLPDSAVAAWRVYQRDQKPRSLPAQHGFSHWTSSTSSRRDDGPGGFQNPTKGLEGSESSRLKGFQPAQSAKVQALLRNLEKEQHRGRDSTLKPGKSVVFSQWTKMLDLVAEALQRSGYQYTRIDGQSSLQNRYSEIQRFDQHDCCTVMLASIGSAAEGVDLTAARYIHLLEPHWNPMIEAQAVDRIHRIGQSCDVTVTRYHTENSIEDYVRWVQEDKKQMINQSLSSAADSQMDLDRQRCEKLQQILGVRQIKSICCPEPIELEQMVVEM
ncbi:SNF2 family N-terminal domain-containing protein [Aspergillus karnatakaensis]|uniref:DEAD/DEAH box helicase n=1 Tax=Aspergillus karnatakaensis TaxID=1810916 RepID=UPI003CCD0737